MDQSRPPDSALTGPADRWLSLAEGLAACARQVQRLTAVPEGLRLPEVLLLWLCGQGSSQGVAQAELARRLAVSAAQASQLLEKLRRLGWLEAYRPAADRRCQHWRLTLRGVQVLREVERELAPWVAELEKRSEATLVDRMCAALGELTQALESHTEACAKAGNERRGPGAGPKCGPTLPRPPLERGAA